MLNDKSILSIIIIIQLLSGFNSIKAQNKQILQVLKKNNVGKSYYFNYSSKRDELDKVTVKYLGEIKTDSGKMYKIISWERIWGKNYHTNCSIYVYGSNNLYVGRYYVGESNDLPYKLLDCSLFFSNRKKTGCDTKIESVINFCKGLPKEFFLKCKGNSGDFYSFSTD